MQNTQLDKNAITALCSKAKLAMQLAAALCLALRKLLAKAGALLMLKRLNAKLASVLNKKAASAAFLLPSNLCASLGECFQLLNARNLYTQARDV